MSFQTRKTFVHLLNTNEDMFDAFRELSDPPIDSKDPYSLYGVCFDIVFFVWTDISSALRMTLKEDISTGTYSTHRFMFCAV